MQLEINQAHGTLKNVYFNTANNGDERFLCGKLKFELDVPLDALRALFPLAPNMLDAHFDKGGNLIDNGLTHAYRIPLENVSLTIDDLSPITGVKVLKNMRLIPRDGARFDVTLVCYVVGVTDSRPLTKRLHEAVKVSIIEQQEQLGIEEAA